MTTVFMLFLTLNGVPIGATQILLPMEPTCQVEMRVVEGMNQFYDKNDPRMHAHGSCEPFNISGAAVSQ